MCGRLAPAGAWKHCLSSIRAGPLLLYFSHRSNSEEVSEMGRKRFLVVLMALALLIPVAMAAGCGSSDETGSEASEPSTGPQSGGSQMGPDGKLMTLADFPQDQDGANVLATIKTDKGDIVLSFFPDDAPVHVASFLHLARSGFYNGTTFHRVEPGLIIQGGDPNTKDPAKASMAGTGGPGYNLPAEFNSKPHTRGTLSMARAQDPDSAGSQFFICMTDYPAWDGQYTVFGQVESGMEVVDQITPGDVMREVVVQPKPAQ